MDLIRRIGGRLRREWWKAKAWYLRTVYGYHHTGERVCPDFPDENFRNHLRVYAFASQFVGGRKVLDVGCGTGYGTAYFLRQGAVAVTGIDLAEEAIAYAQRKFGTTGAVYLAMNAEAIALPAGSFDMVFSSENLEHLPHPEECLKSVRTVLRDGGIFVLGTPNREMDVDEQGELHHDYHVREFSFEELRGMLEPLFSHVVIFENSLPSPTTWGRTSREDRVRRGAVGIAAPPSRTVQCDGLAIDCTALHNTHSFMVVAW